MKRAIVTGGTKGDADAMAVLAMNLVDVCPQIADELVILHDGISEEKQAQIKKIMPVRFIKYKCPIPMYKWILNKSVRYFSTMVFCKFEILRLLEEYDEVMWTDYDILIREPIDELWSATEKCYTVINHEVPLRNMFFDGIDKVQDFKFDMSMPSACTPLVVVKRNIGDYMSMYKWCYEQAEKYIRYLYLPEQCIFTMMLEEFDVTCDEIDQDVYCRHPKEALEKTKILHAYGQPKFWNGLENASWNRYYEQFKNTHS